jgi:uncharacterized Zn finger protein
MPNISTGRRVCPKCGSDASQVVETNRDDHGVAVRTCKCKQCGRVFYTAQEPEYLVPRERLVWTRGASLRGGWTLGDQD